MVRVFVVLWLAFAGKVNTRRNAANPTRWESTTWHKSHDFYRWKIYIRNYKANHMHAWVQVSFMQRHRWGAFYTMVAGKKSESVLIVCSVRITVMMMIIGQKAPGVWGFLEAIYAKIVEHDLYMCKQMQKVAKNLTLFRTEVRSACTWFASLFFFFWTRSPVMYNLALCVRLCEFLAS